jgi:hypothetical protein
VVRLATLGSIITAARATNGVHGAAFLLNLGSAMTMENQPVVRLGNVSISSSYR